MIGYLEGTVIGSEAGKSYHVNTIKAGSVGYELRMATLLTVGDGVKIWVHSEEAALYGFLTKDDRKLFRAVIKTSGVGPSTALAGLSALGAAGFAAALRRGDVTQLSRIPGVGRRTAEKLAVSVQLPEGLGDDSELAGVAAEVRDLLVALGHSPSDAAQLAANVPADVENVDDGLRIALANRGAA